MTRRACRNGWRERGTACSELGDRHRSGAREVATAYARRQPPHSERQAQHVGQVRVVLADSLTGRILDLELSQQAERLDETWVDGRGDQQEGQESHVDGSERISRAGRPAVRRYLIATSPGRRSRAVFDTERTGVRCAKGGDSYEHV